MDKNPVHITVGEFIENIRKNGLPKTHRALFRFVGWSESFNDKPMGKEKIASACAFGQGLINSHAYFNIYSNEDEFIARFYDSVWSLNDLDRELTFDVIADKLLEAYHDKLNKVLTFEYFDYTDYLPKVTA